MDSNKNPPPNRRILILAPFFRAESAWISDFCARPDLEFKKAPFLGQPISWHQRGPTTSFVEWTKYLSYSYHAMNCEADCIITCFPQLALVTAALLQLKRRRKTRLIAWNFNIGSLASRWKGHLAGRILDRIDRFVVHSRGEIGRYAQWLGVEEPKFRFVPLQRGKIAAVKLSRIRERYIVSMGSANRDYGTLFDAIVGTGIKTVIISKKSVVDRLPEHPDLVKLHSLTPEECNSILSGAVLNVIPITSTQTASGQVTFTTSMRMGIPTIATRCVGTTDYIRNDETGVLVPTGDAAALREAIESLWRDEALRLRIGSAGRDYADEHFSDEAAGRHLAQIIDELFREGPEH